jgi:hypothetical protein
MCLTQGVAQPFAESNESLLPRASSMNVQQTQGNLAVFTQLQGSLESEAALREKIRDTVRDFDSNTRALSAQ